ncbi:acyl-CoA dehydrogenase [Phaeacidiphilus oryzae]|uniref:acyl-CoA dehydrogenase n=1 Tax=Phaeacidiphilus oryzae TaxID=348818 RepID=UPI000569A59A|nr:acyl-CoA dehydrogenase [Phaeacidiphilus oryzae]
MGIALSGTERELADAVRGFVGRHAALADTRSAFDRLARGGRPAHWDALLRQGLHAVHLPEEVGGQGGTLADLAVVLEQSAHGLLPGPLLPTAVAGALAVRLPAGEARSELLKELAGGATAALVPPAGGDGAEDADGPPVLGLLSAELLIVGVADGATGRIRWLRVDPEAAGPLGLRRVPETGVDLTRDIGRLRLPAAGVPATAADLGELPPQYADFAASAAVALAACEAAGVMRWGVETAVEHARVREQFGRPIGSFQAVKHRLARLRVGAELAAASAWDAVQALGEPAGQRRIAVAGAALAAQGRAAGALLDTILALGGIGFTWEHDAHLYWRRAISLAALAGAPEIWQRRLGEAALTERRRHRIALDEDEERRTAPFRARVAEVLDEVRELPPDSPGHLGADFGPRRDRLAAAGLVAPHYPKPWGLAATPVQQLVVAEELERRGLAAPSLAIGAWVLPTLLAHGSPEQIERFVPGTLRAGVRWCQLFSEPGAGSDLAGLATRAERTHGGWLLNGQKVWTSGAHAADWGFCLARTDPDAPRHRGLSCFLVDMSAPGVEVRPLRQATGESGFNEVFLDGVFVPDDCLVGEPGAGWRASLTTLGNERLTISSSMSSGLTEPIRRLVADAGGPAREAGLRALGRIEARAGALAALNLRETLRRLDGQQPGAGASLSKVAAAELDREAAEAALALAGPEAAVRPAGYGGGPGDSGPGDGGPGDGRDGRDGGFEGGGGPVDAAGVELLLPSRLIGGGTMEIQLNVIAERVLGLPRG